MAIKLEKTKNGEKKDKERGDIRRELKVKQLFGLDSLSCSKKFILILFASESFNGQLFDAFVEMEVVAGWVVQRLVVQTSELKASCLSPSIYRHAASSH